MNAPLVPDPSSREITSMAPLAALAVAANAVVPISAAVTTVTAGTISRKLLILQ